MRRIIGLYALLLAGCGCDGDRGVSLGTGPAAVGGSAEGALAPSLEAVVETAEARREDRGAPSDEPAADCEQTKATVKLASPETARRAGIVTAAVEEKPLTLSVRANGTIELDERRVARISSRVPGIVREVAGLEGASVAAGETLAVIDSPELGEAKAALRQAVGLVDVRKRVAAMERELVAGGTSARRESILADAALAEAEIDLERARQRLRSLGLADDAVAKVESGEDKAGTLALLAPFDGVVVERAAAAGEVVEASRTLFLVADVATVFAVLDLAERDFASVEPGARILFAPDALPGQVFRGKVLSRAATLDPETRTGRAIAEGKTAARGGASRPLAPGMFGRAEVVTRDKEPTLVVPRDAVQWEGCHFIVFVEMKEGTYQARAVELGAVVAEHPEVLGGLMRGVKIVTTGSYLLKTEVLKGSIGAGCCD